LFYFVAICLPVCIRFIPVVETFLFLPPADGFVPASLSALLTTKILISV
jgi:hypothetical protein